MARLQLVANGIEWAAGLLIPHEHEPPLGELEGEWTPHQHLTHLCDTERNVHGARIEATLRDERPVFSDWDQEAAMRDYRPDGTLVDAIVEFVGLRKHTVELLKGAGQTDWARTAVWPDGREVDLAWLAYRTMAHSLEHFHWLMYAATTYETHYSRRWGLS
jgi:hypothetical protein